MSKQSQDHNDATGTVDEPPAEIMALLTDIHCQNKTMMNQFDALEANITRRATIAGAMTGAFTGGVGGTVVSVGIELIKAKFGG